MSKRMSVEEVVEKLRFWAEKKREAARTQPDDITEELNELGNDPQTIAANLHRLGIRGLRDEPVCCPIANYLILKGYSGVYVAGKRISINTFSQVARVLSMDAPEPVREFVKAFDQGLFEELVA